MRVLWITNILFPEVNEILSGSNELKASGGWMLGAAKGLLSHNDIEVYGATVSSAVKVLTKLEGKYITYFIIPLGKGNLKKNSEYRSYWQQINSEIKPEITHIHGTEYSHGYEYMQACGNKNVVISIQGMKSAYYHHYCGGITKYDILKNVTIRDLFRGGIIKGQYRFKESAIYEFEMLRHTKHIIGRTSWDRARTWAINPNAKYHFCNETLREEFYNGEVWDYNNCIKHSIFLSQANYPIKGLHQILKAMPLILRDYPDTIIRVAGRDITKLSNLKDFLHLSGYGRYIKSLIKRLNLGSKIIFCGELNATEMKTEYLSSNVFVCPSSIENSPNSLGEAQLLGVPCVASYVGGIPDMMKGKEDNLYRFEEFEMMAYRICQIFARQESPDMEVRRIALDRHESSLNSSNLYNIYHDIIYSHESL